LAITFIPKERFITNKLKVIHVDNNTKIHTEGSKFKSDIVKNVEVTLLHLYSSISH